MIGIEDTFLKEEECENLIRIFGDWSIRSKKHRDIHVLHLYEIEIDLNDKEFCHEICARTNKRINQISHNIYPYKTVPISYMLAFLPKNHLFILIYFVIIIYNVIFAGLNKIITN